MIGYAAMAVVAPAGVSRQGFHAHGRCSATRWIGWSGSLTRMSVSQARGLKSFILMGWIGAPGDRQEVCGESPLR